MCFSTLLATLKVQSNVEKMQESIVKKCRENFLYHRLGPLARYQYRAVRSAMSQKKSKIPRLIQAYQKSLKFKKVSENVKKHCKEMHPEFFISPLSGPLISFC